MVSLIRVANAPCSWGALEFEGMQAERIGYAQMLDELVETGYSGTELGDWGFMPSEPDTLRAELKRRGVTMLGAFVPVALRDPAARVSGEAQALRVAHLLAALPSADEGFPVLVLADDNGADPVRTANAGRVTADMGLSDDEWRVFAQGVEHIARRVRDETGLRTVFHHHCAGFVETPSEIARFLDLTDPALVGLVFDTGHLAYGAGPGGCEVVLPALDHFGNRVWYVHLKDCQPDVVAEARRSDWDYFEAVRHGVFCELGQGCVDFPSVVGGLRQRGYGGWLTVEQDVLPGMGTPRDSARRNRDYLAQLGL